MKLLNLLAVIVLLAVTFAGGYVLRAPRHANAQAGGRRILYYVDPMHPSYKSDKPGIAPDCGMQLTPVYADDSEDSEKKERKILYYVDPMNPSYRSDKPGKAPDGMDLTPVYAEEEEGGAPGTVKLSGRKQQLINLKVVTVQEGLTGQNIRTVGTLQYDETKIAKLHSRIEGWIDKVYVA